MPAATDVADCSDKRVTFEEWSRTIQSTFEKHFYIDTVPRPEYEPNPELIVHRGMYKDCYYATQFWANFQLRPNFCVAIVVVSVSCRQA